jgi:uncharacterized protein YuzE
MKVEHDPRTDTLTILLADVPVAESDAPSPGVIPDYDAEGRLVGLEILDASMRVEQPSRVEVSVALPERPAAE